MVFHKNANGHHPYWTQFFALGVAVFFYWLFLEEKHFTSGKEFPYNIHPLAFLEYNEEKIFARLKEIGWERPVDTDPNSTNCLMNAFSNQVHEKMYGYNPYVFEIAKMVREGVMTREAGLKKFRETVPAEQIDIVKERLGI